MKLIAMPARAISRMLAVAWVVLFMTAPYSVALAREYGGITGHVYDAETGLPVCVAATMRNYTIHGGQIINPDGSYAAMGYVSPAESMCIEASGYLPSWYGGASRGEFARTFPLGPEGRQGVDLYLDRAGTGIISGNVTDRDGVPVWSARVVAYREVQGHGIWDPVEVLAITGARGEFCIAGLPATTYRIGIVVDRSGEPDYWYGGTTLESATTVPLAEAQHEGPIVVELPIAIGRRAPLPPDSSDTFPNDFGYTMVYGQVLDAATGRPVSVPLGNYWFSGADESGADGSFGLGAYRSTNTRVWARPRERYYASCWDGQPLECPEMFRTGVTPEWGINLLLNEIGDSSIRGRLVDAAGEGAPSRRIIPLVYSPRLGIWDPVEVVAVTDSNGDYVVRGLPAGRYRLGVPSPDGGTHGPLLRHLGIGTAEGEVGTSADVDFGELSMDTTSPVTTLIGVPSSWATAPVGFRLTAADEVGGSGVGTTYYQLGSGGAQVYSGQVTVSAPGTTTVTYWSVDRDGNAEDVQTDVVRVDSLAPVTEFGPQVSFAIPATVSLQTSDTTSGSGVASTHWRYGHSGDWTTGGDVGVAEPGTHTIEYYSVDAAGNVEGVKQASFFAGPATSLLLRAPSVSGYRAAQLSGVLTDSDAKRLKFKPVRIEYFSGGVWRTLGTDTTDRSGEYSWLARPRRATVYRARFEGDMHHAPSLWQYRTVLPKASLTTPVFRRGADGSTTAELRAGRTYVVSGIVRPEHASGGGDVVVRLYRFERGEWVYERSYATASSAAEGYSRYSAKVRIGTSGRWSVKAYHPRDTENAATYSGRRSVRVR